MSRRTTETQAPAAAGPTEGVRLAPRDRRLAPRADVDVDIEWVVPRRRFRRVVEVAERAHVQNVSIGGLQILARTVERFVPGSVAPIRCEGHAGLVNVRWIGPSERRGMSVYGVKLVAPSHELLAALLRGTDLLLTESDDLVWSLVTEPT